MRKPRTRIVGALDALCRLARSERGMSTVIVALMLPVLLTVEALTVDTAHLFVERRSLQNAADAAALAAAVYLPSTDPAVLEQARSEAIEYAARNGVTISTSDIVFTSQAATNDRVTVRTDGGVDFFFAERIGLSFGAVSSLGSAQIGTVGARGGVMPWGVNEPVGGFVFGQSYCLKLGSNGGGSACNTHVQGNFQALDIDDTGTSSANEYRDRILSGSQTVVAVGDVKQVASGNMNGPTQQGTGCSGNNGRISGNTQTFAQVIEANPSGGYTVLDWSSPRLVIIPVIQVLSAQEVRITGFSIFFLDSCGTNGAVIGRFIDTVLPGGEWAEWSPTSGARMVRLVP